MIYTAVKNQVHLDFQRGHFHTVIGGQGHRIRLVRDGTQLTKLAALMYRLTKIAALEASNKLHVMSSLTYNINGNES